MGSAKQKHAFAFCIVSVLLLLLLFLFYVCTIMQQDDNNHAINILSLLATSAVIAIDDDSTSGDNESIDEEIETKIAVLQSYTFHCCICLLMICIYYGFFL
jgi:hypothetical protein